MCMYEWVLKHTCECTYVCIYLVAIAPFDKCPVVLSVIYCIENRVYNLFLGLGV